MVLFPFPTEVKPTSLTVLCYVTYVTLSIPFNLVPIFLTVMQTQYHHPGQERLTDEELGLLTAAPFLGVSISTIATAVFADRFGAKPAALVGNFTACFGLVVSGLAPNYWSLIVALVILGFGAGAIDMIIPPLVSALNVKNRGAHINYLNGVYWLGAVAANLFGISALWFGMSFNYCCFSLAPCPALMFVLMLFFKFPSLTEGPAMSFVSLIKKPWFELSLVAIIMGGAASMGLANWLNYYAAYLGFPPEIADWMLLFYGICMFLGRMIAGFLSTRISSYNILLCGCAVSFFLFGLVSFGSPGVCLVAALCVGVTASPMWPTVLAVTADEYKDGGPLMFGLLSSGGNLGGFFMPWLVGYVAGFSNLRWGLATAGLAIVFMVPAVYWMKRTRLAHTQVGDSSRDSIRPDSSTHSSYASIAGV